MIYVVLGCHKSGTTLISEILHRSGIPMVEDDVHETDYDEGDFFERLDWVMLNQEIIGHRDPASDFADPLKVIASESERERIASEIQRMQDQHESWGFKDPRTCITYPIWNELLPEHTVIGIYRSLPEVWAHEARGGWARRSLWKTIRMWVDYNRRLADVIEGRRHYGLPTILLSFEALMTGDSEFARFEDFMSQKLTDPRQPDRYHSSSRSRLRIRIADYVLGQLGYAQPSVVKERLDVQCRGE